MEQENQKLVLDGARCFTLVDTFGMPFDMMLEVLKERGLTFNWVEFVRAALGYGWKIEKLRDIVETAFPKKECPPVLINTITHVSLLSSPKESLDNSTV